MPEAPNHTHGDNSPGRPRRHDSHQRAIRVSGAFHCITRLPVRVTQSTLDESVAWYSVPPRHALFVGEVDACVTMTDPAAGLGREASVARGLIEHR
jgi:hypothetical protein